jgi:hypothetical protein
MIRFVAAGPSNNLAAALAAAPVYTSGQAWLLS